VARSGQAPRDRAGRHRGSQRERDRHRASRAERGPREREERRRHHVVQRRVMEDHEGRRVEARLRVRRRAVEKRADPQADGGFRDDQLVRVEKGARRNRREQGAAPGQEHPPERAQRAVRPLRHESHFTSRRIPIFARWR
jgi:hypothetical protein